LCRSHYGGSFQIKIGTTDEHGRTLMSLAPVVEPGGDSQPVLRIWLDGEQMRRLREGKYFGTVLRSENGCWIRGNLEDSGLLLMDNANAPADDPEQAGSFYNKAPRFTVFGDNAYDCEPIK
jgi:hypothetical protein